jgi:hypothetical protein
MIEACKALGVCKSHVVGEPYRRFDDLRIPHAGAEALIGQGFVQKATRP